MTAAPPAAPVPPWWRRITRDLVLFGAGLALVAHETVAVAEPRYLLLIVAAGALGLPGVLRFDEARRTGDGGK